MCVHVWGGGGGGADCFNLNQVVDFHILNEGIIS